ncbi:FAD-dependent oxidoreductase [Saccharopolyspora sp. CA-218241]|uniref:FAD-dependent oxidoreductase n=1 Tax=Saccharopolyspora sp. CA-218241 TaxID=3240027 RepID=UPI003D96299F
MTASAKPVLVIGAGVQGLTSAVVLAEQGRAVRIRTAERPGETTSAAAGALWGPALLRPADKVLHWVTRSHAEFTALARDERTGVRLVPGRMAARHPLGEALPPEVHLIPDLRRCDREELPAGFVDGYAGTLPLIDMPGYLAYLVERFRAAGGEIVLSGVPSLADATAEADVVVNCTGVGARELVGDPGVQPVWGQQVVVRNPGVQDYFIELSRGGEFVSWMPHADRLVLGGIAVDGEWSRAPRPDVGAAILHRCAEVEPRLADVEVSGDVVGLRPGRERVRVEAEEFNGARVVHDYGHGGSGVALSWGCAFEVAELIG